MSTQEIVERHLAAFGEGDVEATMADYADDAVMISPNGVRRGAAEIREAFEAFFSGLFAPGTYDFTLDLATYEGETGYIVWHAECTPVNIAYASDTFVVRDGKIVTQTVALKVEPK